jgi:hypothetical protein
MSSQSSLNPFTEFWQELKGRGKRVQSRGPHTLYRVPLSKEELEKLMLIAVAYPEVWGVVSRIDNNVVDFYGKEAIDLAHKSSLK